LSTSRRKRTARSALALLALAPLGLASCLSPKAGEENPPEAISLLGEELRRPEYDAERLTLYEERLQEAQRRFVENPYDESTAIALGRQLAFLGRYRIAADRYTEALQYHPGSPRILRHRGHVRITLREFDRAVEDLELAAGMLEGAADEEEQSGAPNAEDRNTASLESSVWFHLALAQYMNRDFEAALASWRRSDEVAARTSDDMLVASTAWHYVTARRLGHDDEAAQLLELAAPGRRNELQLLENGLYLEVLLLFRGERAPQQVIEATGFEIYPGVESATRGYMVGGWHHVNGRSDEGNSIWRSVLRRTEWPFFGHIAAEAEIAAQRAARTPEP
jgi:tetratricopeptide (TPR) repeat protein